MQNVIKTATDPPLNNYQPRKVHDSLNWPVSWCETLLQLVAVAQSHTCQGTSDDWGWGSSHDRGRNVRDSVSPHLLPRSKVSRHELLLVHPVAVLAIRPRSPQPDLGYSGGESWNRLLSSSNVLWCFLLGPLYFLLNHKLIKNRALQTIMFI